MAGIYIHIPFCKQACFYCDFHFSTSLKKKDALLACLHKELEIRKGEFDNEVVETIYFGGGTPSLLSTGEIDVLLRTIYSNYQVIGDPEITLEANPDDLTEVVLAELAASGINRLSIGVQSYNEADLALMNRAHNAQEAQQCLTLATKLFDNITIDLIYGIPTMSEADWRSSLQRTFDFGIQHISSYALTVEPKTKLEHLIKKGEYKEIDETLAKQHFDILVAETEAQGFVHYEISNFGKPGYFSKHNTSYWQGKKYLGIGPSAHSFNTTHRSWNIANNAKYIKALEKDELPAEIEFLETRDRYNEYLMTGLRTIWGISLNKVSHDFGNNYVKLLQNEATRFVQQGVLEFLQTENDIILKTTHQGKFLADGIASDLFRI
ncbi:Coproporphyrinogen III oxidase [Tenacibaculum litopenaei]|uniref:radical SAM family heme chaperone HemW n=1 Tax=Tenacibaculum litopenaei TaxID=396016 RepID=UPI003894BF3E